MVDKSEKFNWFVRLGFFSRGVLYSLIGIIALTSAGKIAEGTDGVFNAIEDFPLGTVLLWLMVLGLVAYGLFRLASFAFDIENHGSDGKGWGQRLGHAGSGIGHFALAYSAYRFATAGDAANSGGGGAQEAAGGVLSMDFGGVVLGLLGIAFFIAAIAQAKKGLTASFMQRISASAPSWTRIVGRVGYLARAVVFAIVGWSLVQAGFLSGGSSEVRTLGDALANLAGSGIIFTLVALGLIAFGVLSFVLARYRVIPDMGSDGKVPSFRV